MANAPRAQLIDYSLSRWEPGGTAPGSLREGEEVVVSLLRGWDKVVMSVQIQTGASTGDIPDDPGAAESLRDVAKKVSALKSGKLSYVPASSTVLVVGELSPDGIFELIDIYVGIFGSGRYLDSDEKGNVAYAIGVKMAETIYRGPYYSANMTENVLSSVDRAMIAPVHERLDKNGRVAFEFVR